jgi:hypothetical protein
MLRDRKARARDLGCESSKFDAIDCKPRKKRENIQIRLPCRKPTPTVED